MKHDSINDLVVGMYKTQLDHIKEALAEYEPVVTATSGSSVTVQFRALPKGLTHKLRVADSNDHNEHPFKWQLQTGGVPPKEMRKPFIRYYDNPVMFTSAFKAYYDAVARQGD